MALALALYLPPNTVYFAYMLPLPGQPPAQDSSSPAPLRLFNTLTRTKEVFSPVRSDYVRLYDCGPTVYDFAHIGNLRAYVFADILRRTLRMNGYKVKQVMNITDVGHLTSDSDDGDDKMTVGLKREGLPLTLEGMKELADRYSAAFVEDLDALLIKRPNDLPRASEHVVGMIALIETLMEKEYAYRTSDGVYFDTARFKEYGKLGGIVLDKQKEGARVVANPEKRHPIDFALWKRDDHLGWDSPWGKGFPGWHIECSAMSMEYLGKELDIHTGGVDHIGTHHNNEIAQSEAATGKPFARFWMHSQFLNIEGTKISKSLQNTITLRQLIEHNYNPVAYRYLLLTSHYRTLVNFSWDALDAAQTALTRLHRMFAEDLMHESLAAASPQYVLELKNALNDDLDTARALSVLWKVTKDTNLTASEKRATLLYFDKILGLGLRERSDASGPGVTLSVVSLPDLPSEVRALVTLRDQARSEKDFARSDTLRAEIESLGYTLEDSPEGAKLRKK